MTHLVVLGLDSREDAERVLLTKEREEELIEALQS